MTLKRSCFICNNGDCIIEPIIDDCGNYQFFDCPQCGKYIWGGDKFRNIDYFPYFNTERNCACIMPADKLQSFMYYHNSDSYAMLGDKNMFDEYAERKFKYPVKYITQEEIENWYPKNIYEKIDKILLKIKDLSQFDGDSVTLDYETASRLFLVDLVKCKDGIDEETIVQRQIEYIIETLLELQYITIKDWQAIKQGFFSNHFLKGYLSKSFLEIVLTAKGLAKVYDLQKNQVSNKNVFIAMSFSPAVEGIYNAIDSAIRAAKCEVVSMKHRIHNKQIVPEMLRLIKESRILVMDISEPNFGAYYEAGYAQGLGKEVIFTCKSSVMKQDKFPCDVKKGAECDVLKKYSKPHFDIAQKQILVWEAESDLTEQLTEWIKFLVG